VPPMRSRMLSTRMATGPDGPATRRRRRE
jgi:hypothetical protein